MIDNEALKEFTEHIILDHAKDIEYLSIGEMAIDLFEDLCMESSEEKEQIIKKISQLINEAKITISFE